MSKRIVIIGGGPIGLEAAAYGRAAGLDVSLYEQRDFGSNVSAWGFVRMFTPWHLNTTPLGRELAGDDPVLASHECPTGYDFVHQYVLPIADSGFLRDSVETGVRVLAVGREDVDLPPSARVGHPPRFRLLVCDRFGSEQVDHADVVLDCSGTYGNRRWVGRGGVPAIGEAGVKSSVWYIVPDILGIDRTSFENRRTLLIGSGTAALTVLLHLSHIATESPATRVVWAVRRWGEVLSLAGEDPLPQRRALAEHGLRLLAKPPDWLEVLEDATVERLDASHGLCAWLRLGQEVVERHVDEVIAAVGFKPDETVHEPLGISPGYADVSATRAALDAGDLSGETDTAHAIEGDSVVPMVGPNYFLVGHKSFGSNSNFLLRAGHRQVREVFRQITGDRRLDLYGAVRQCAGVT